MGSLEKEEYMVISRIKKGSEDKINLAKYVIDEEYRYPRNLDQLRNSIKDDEIMFITIVESREQLDEFKEASFGMVEIIYKIRPFK